MDKKLTAKQKRFIEEYLIDLNATQAAKRAGYSERTAKQIGTENLSKLAIREAIQARCNKRSERTEITADYVLTSLQEVVERCMQHEEVKDREGNGTGEYQFQHAGANRALELLGKNLKLFTDVVKIEEESLDPLEQLAKYGELVKKYGLDPERL